MSGEHTPFTLRPTWRCRSPGMGYCCDPVQVQRPGGKRVAELLPLDSRLITPKREERPARLRRPHRGRGRSRATAREIIYVRAPATNGGVQGPRADHADADGDLDRPEAADVRGPATTTATPSRASSSPSPRDAARARRRSGSTLGRPSTRASRTCTAPRDRRRRDRHHRPDLARRRAVRRVEPLRPPTSSASSTGCRRSFMNTAERHDDHRQRLALLRHLRARLDHRRDRPGVHRRPDLFPRGGERMHVETIVDALLKPDIQTRYEAYKAARQAGWLTANEIRALENYPPVDGGDVLQVTPGRRRRRQHRRAGADDAGEGARAARASSRTTRPPSSAQILARMLAAPEAAGVRRDARPLERR
jgi:hypothetical protein